MEIAGLTLAVVLAFAGWIAYRQRRAAHGAESALTALAELVQASNEGKSIFVRDHGIFGNEGQQAARRLERARLATRDRKLSALLAEIEVLYKRAEAKAMPAATVNALEIAARHFEVDQPAHRLISQIDAARDRAIRLDRRRAGTY